MRFQYTTSPSEFWKIKERHMAIGEIVCEDLSVGKCAYSVDSLGKRCTLETYESSEGTTGYQCKTSEVVVAINGIANWIESDECISACGANRDSVGISSDYLLESSFTFKLCSQQCYQKCPNIVDLYYNLALGEGVYLPAFCKGKKLNGRREMSQIQSSGAALAPASDGYGRQLTEGPAASTGYGGGYGRQLSEGPAASPAITFDDMDAAAPW
ncbi:hypothetical protein A4A49_05887 [Nicotiana attenuata]|uniref:PAR1 protein n=1 Tax=Nicotiana attenuata TaxID=49451 RepID=A0A1J6J1Z7_NICAT|nr:hypothetical protein A4A49_05887 [Nicotiana attenuata]